MTRPLFLNTQRPWNLIRRCPAYQPTPMHEISMPNGLRTLIKDETDRFGLGSFKALGGIYAVAAFLLEQWQTENGSDLDPRELFEGKVEGWSGKFTFVCASAGNHGIAVAKGARLLNAKCRVHLADSVPESFASKLGDLHAEVVRSGMTYEDSMGAARDDCKNGGHGEILIADSSWPGYTKIPSLVMAGYTVMAEEMRERFLVGDDWPSHVFLQAGVGGLAAAIAYHIRQTWQRQPLIIVVEPEAAPCLFESNRLGRLTTVRGPVSSMGRLDCKEASLVAFSALQQSADRFVCVGESDAADAVSLLAVNDIETTPSGAAGVAATLAAQRLHISMPDDATCLAIATEGRV